MADRTDLSNFLRKVYNIGDDKKAFIHHLRGTSTPIFIIYTVNYHPSGDITESRWKRSKVVTMLRSLKTVKVWESFVPPVQRKELELADVRTSRLQNLDTFNGPVPPSSLIFKIDLSGDYFGTTKNISF